MGSKTFEGVWFITYAHDHAPPHVHGFYAESVVIVELLAGGMVRKADRWDAVVPANAKRSDIRHILDAAAKHSASLLELWEKMHGPAS